MLCAELLTRTTVFPRFQYSRDEVVTKVLGQGQLPWEDSETAGQLLPQLRALRCALKRSVLACLARDPAERPSCKQVLSAWNQVVMGTAA